MKINRFVKPSLLSDKKISQTGMETTYEICTNMDHCNSYLVKWFDMRPVKLVLNFLGSGTESIRR